jgi:aspartate racemase
MQLGFYTERLAQFGIETIIPEQEDVEYINYTIYNEFSKNIFTVEAKQKLSNIISKLKGGVQRIIGLCRPQFN